ncbi:RNA/RNP complex-1-interacting phosphatase isoform X2 [Anolis carolinensis]|uniref:RNA/RNP complex-1-interacting phosphatase isoform X2 n=1 Tax=Anolis carolinensis TaxID=28377 RepID=UPI000462E170
MTPSMRVSGKTWKRMFNRLTDFLWEEGIEGSASLEAKARGAEMGKRNNNNNNNSSKLPDRWKHYLPLGRRLPKTRFIAFKVPLHKRFDFKLAPQERFTPEDLLSQIREQKEDLGLIIDLTYTTRYYQPKELPDTLQYCKILTVGHEVPANDTIYRFKSVVMKFLAENQHNDKLIGVHCTHGLNRTGYLVCRYLIDVEGMDPNKAIELFNSCRGHSIERKNYIEDLRRRSERRNPPPVAVPKCSWIKERSGPIPRPDYESGGPMPHPDYEIINCGPQRSLPFRHFDPRGGLIPPRPPYPGQSLVPHYQAPPMFCPPFPPTTSFIPQSLRPSPGLFYAPCQQPLPEGPPSTSFPVQSPHGQRKRKRNRKKRRSQLDYY